MSASRADLRLMAARRLLESERLDAAEATLDDVPETERVRPDIAALDAEIALRKRDFDRARRLFGDMLDADPSGDVDVAAAHAGLAAAHLGLGDFEDAARAFIEAIKLGATDTRAWLGAAQGLFALGAWDALDNLTEQARTDDRVDAATTAAMSALSALGLFARGDHARCRDAITRRFGHKEDADESMLQLVAWRKLIDADPGAHVLPERKALHAILSYHDYLIQLMDYRSAHPTLYDAPDTPALHIIGDSHCLAPAHTGVTLDGVRHRVVPHPVLGAKAWHLAPAVNPPANAQRAAFVRLANAIAGDAPVITMFGEIDCRVDEGLFPVLKDQPEDIVEARCRDLAEAHVAYLSEVLGPARRVIVYGVPAPDPVLIRKAAIRGRGYPHLVAAFNRSLGVAARSAGLGFLDRHAATADAAGAATDRWRFDGIHQAPPLLATLLEGLHVTAE